MVTIFKSYFNIALIGIAFIGIIFSSTAFAESTPPSNKKLILDFDESFKIFKDDISSSFLSNDKKLFERVVSTKTKRIINKKNITEDRLRVAFLIYTKVDTHTLSKVMNQRKKERDFFGVLNKQRDDKRDAFFKNLFESLAGYEVYTLDFIETSHNFWKAKNSTLKDSTLDEHKEVIRKETQLLKKEVFSEIKKQNQLDTNQKSKDKLKNWIKADKKPWMLSDDNLMQLSNTTYYTGNRCSPLSVTLKNAIRACEDTVFYNTVLDMQCPKSKDSTNAIFEFVRFDGEWISRYRLLNKYRYDKNNKAIFEKLTKEAAQSKQSKCPDGSDMIRVMSFRTD